MALCFSSVTCPHCPVIWPYLICSLPTSGHVTSFTWVLHLTRPSVSARMEMQRHLTTIKTVTIAATPLLINFLTSQPGPRAKFRLTENFGGEEDTNTIESLGCDACNEPILVWGLKECLKSADSVQSHCSDICMGLTTSNHIKILRTPCKTD